MGASLHSFPEDSSVKALIPLPPVSASSTCPQPLSSPSFPTSNPCLAPVFHQRFDRCDFSPSSSSSSEIARLPPDNLPRRRKSRRPNRERKVDLNGECKQRLPPPQKAASKHLIVENRRGCKENVCCKCAAGFTADCAAICCCPLALLHLLALTFIKLPSTVVWRLLVSMKKRLCSKRSPTDLREEDSPRPNCTPPWSYGDSPEGSDPLAHVGSDPLAHVVRFDSQKLWKHFEAGHLGFGGLSIKRD